MTRVATPTEVLTPKPMTLDHEIVVSNSQIARLACANWERGGKPEGRFFQHWLSAEAELNKAAMHVPGGSTSVVA